MLAINNEDKNISFLGFVIFAIQWTFNEFKSYNCSI